RDDKNDDPLAKSDKEKKRRKRKDYKPLKDDQAGSSKKELVEDEVVHDKEQPHDNSGPKQDKSTWFKQSPRPETLDPEWKKDLTIHDRPEQNWFNELMNAEKDPLTFDDLIGSTVDFTKFVKNRLKKDKITKAYLRGPTFKLLKGTCRNNIELEYNMDQCYLTLSDQLDWTNPEGDRCPFDISKPLPLQGPLCHLTIHVDFFFNYDLEYLKTGNQDRKYTILLTKTKATRRADLKEYTFREENFSRLHLNDLEDMFLLYVQRKIHNLTGDEIVALVNALRMFTQSIVIQKRVEDVQLGVESYQIKLNITKPQTTCDGISFKEPCTIFYEPRGVVYLNKSNRKRLMRADELYKFSDGTLKSVCDNLNDMLHNFMLGYNHTMPKRAWIEKDQEQTDEMLKMIDNLLLEIQIMRSLECYVGVRINETDNRLRMRTI
ncbi:hypothetical protein Tco_1413366, partial [Tanacetum coccineum]